MSTHRKTLRIGSYGSNTGLRALIMNKKMNSQPDESEDLLKSMTIKNVVQLKPQLLRLQPLPPNSSIPHSFIISNNNNNNNNTNQNSSKQLLNENRESTTSLAALSSPFPDQQQNNEGYAVVVATPQQSKQQQQHFLTSQQRFDRAISSDSKQHHASLTISASSLYNPRTHQNTRQSHLTLQDNHNTSGNPPVQRLRRITSLAGGTQSPHKNSILSCHYSPNTSNINNDNKNNRGGNSSSNLNKNNHSTSIQTSTQQTLIPEEDRMRGSNLNNFIHVNEDKATKNFMLNLRVPLQRKRSESPTSNTTIVIPFNESIHATSRYQIKSARDSTAHYEKHNRIGTAANRSQIWFDTNLREYCRNEKSLRTRESTWIASPSRNQSFDYHEEIHQKRNDCSAQKHQKPSKQLQSQPHQHIHQLRHLHNNSPSSSVASQAFQLPKPLESNDRRRSLIAAKPTHVTYRDYPIYSEKLQRHNYLLQRELRKDVGGLMNRKCGDISQSSLKWQLALNSYPKQPTTTAGSTFSSHTIPPNNQQPIHLLAVGATATAQIIT